MTSPFDNTRMAEILDATIARNSGEKLASKNISIEAKCALMLAFKQVLYIHYPELLGRGTPLEAVNDGLNTLLVALCPDAFTPNSAGVVPYAIVSKLFVADMKDIRNGRL